VSELAAETHPHPHSPPTYAPDHRYATPILKHHRRSSRREIHPPLQGERVRAGCGWPRAGCIGTTSRRRTEV